MWTLICPKSRKCIWEEINGQHFQKKVDTLPAALFVCEKETICDLLIKLILSGIFYIQ